MTKKPSLGVCYFPEQRDETLWQDDIDRMVAMGLQKVRIAEFSWALLEPEEGRYEWEWLDRSIEMLGKAGLDVILCTPTATPPKWLIDKYPDILAVDAEGRPRKFGSRRHYCFSSLVYREKAAGIAQKMAERYGANPYVKAWQIDNEYGCHNTTRSYSDAAKLAFRLWLEAKYGHIDHLNEAWGNIFWSMLYTSFEQVDLPNLSVTEPNPSHVLDFYRFSSDQVVSYNKAQVDILREFSPGRDLIHNFMGFYHEFDHFKVANDLDISAWDSYPTGFLDMFAFSDEEKVRYFRQGHPDISAFHHDLYRGCGDGRWAVIEQQPGPVNWAKHNAIPLPGMIRLWTHEAFAHGAEFLTYFRWDQARYAQEQMHAGLLRPDNAPSPAYNEVMQSVEEMRSYADKKTEKAQIAIVFSYDALWLFEAHPQGAQWSYPDLCFRWYSYLRELGHNIDIVAPETDLSGYKLVIIPSLPHVSERMMEMIRGTDAQILFGPRSGAKTESLQIPTNLAPGPLQALLPVKVTQSESLSDLVTEEVVYKGKAYQGLAWLDHIESDLAPQAETKSGLGVLYNHENISLLGTVPSCELFQAIIDDLKKRENLQCERLPRDIRQRRLGEQSFIFNYGTKSVEYGGVKLPSAGVRFV